MKRFADKLLIAKLAGMAVILLLPLYISAQGLRHDTVNKSFLFKTVIIDPGHGGKDPGAHGTYSLEKNIALLIGKRLKAALLSQMPELNVFMTRDDDAFIELNKRSAIANEHHANLFISIHCNSSPEGTANREHKQIGALVLVYGFHRREEQLEAIRENSSIFQEKDYQDHYDQVNESNPASIILLNAYLQKYRKQSIRFGELLINEFQEHDDRQVIGVKEQGVLVLAHSAMPSVLIETGFINNPIEEKYLNSDAGQEEIVQTIIRAIQKYRREITPQ